MEMGLDGAYLTSVLLIRTNYTFLSSSTTVSPSLSLRRMVIRCEVSIILSFHFGLLLRVSGLSDSGYPCDNLHYHPKYYFLQCWGI